MTVTRGPRVVGAEVLLRQELLRRYSDVASRSVWLRLRYRVKRACWTSVVRGAVLVKRGCDIALSSTLLVVAAPLIGLVAALIKLESPGPVLFRQTRVGRWGRHFDMWKFRSMYADAERRRAQLASLNEAGGGVLFKMKRDPRITRVGRFLRRASIDELPQLWNVLRGDMSLVGPRPPLPSEVAQYTLSDRRRLEVVPGLTCIWQVSGRSNVPFRRQVELDVEYIESQSVWTDLKILLRTVPAVLLGRGAY